MPTEIGQSARVYALQNGEGAISVPLSALHRKGDRPALWVVDPATSAVSLREVEVGPYGEQRVPVLAGVTQEDWVVAAGVHLLLEGQVIKPIDLQNRPVALAGSDAPAAADAR